MKIAILNELNTNEFRIVDVYEDIKDLKTSPKKIDWNTGKIEGENVLQDKTYVILPDIDINVDDFININFINENKIDPGRFVEVDKFEVLETTTETLQDVDDFTLQLTTSLDQRTTDLQGIDEFALDMIFALESKINELEQRIQTLEGSNV